MATNDELYNRLVIGLADIQTADEVHAVTRFTTGASTGLTIGSTTLRLGVAGGTVGFFGTAGSTRASSTAITDVPGLITVLRNYGLFT